MPAIESVGGGVGAKQRRPGGPKFTVELLVQPIPQGLKPQSSIRYFGTAEAVPLSKTKRQKQIPAG
jgi:hypothetical protein